MTSETIDLCGCWEFRQSGKGLYAPATVPGCVHTDLMANGQIPDPFVGDNELGVQWIEEVDWEYRREFTVCDSLLKQPRVELVCEGLDTVATIRVNGQRLASTENMFIGYRFEGKKLLRPGVNQIQIHFHSPLKYILKHRNLCDCTPPNDPVGGACISAKNSVPLAGTGARDWPPVASICPYVSRRAPLCASRRST